MSQEDKRKKVAKDKFLTGSTIASIADGLGVSRRTIERWADDGGWREQKTADKVVSFSKPLQTQPESNHDRPRPRRGRPIDELELVETAICDISAAMSTASIEDLRSLGGLAGALVKLLEYRRKIEPPTVAALAEMAIELGVNPSEFMKALSDTWKLRA